MDSAEPVSGMGPTAVPHAQHPAQPFRENAETAPAGGAPAMAALPGGCAAGAALDPALGAVLFSFTYCQAPTQSSSGDRGRPAGHSSNGSWKMSQALLTPSNTGADLQGAVNWAQ